MMVVDTVGDEAVETFDDGAIEDEFDVGGVEGGYFYQKKMQNLGVFGWFRR